MPRKTKLQPFRAIVVVALGTLLVRAAVHADLVQVAASGINRPLPVLDLGAIGPIEYQPAIVAGDPAGSPTDSLTLRVDPNTTSSVYAGVGSLFMDPTAPYGSGSGFICTGTPITSTHILTAGHCVDGTTVNGIPEFTGAQVFFYLNYGASPSSVIVASAVTAHPDYGGFNVPVGVVNDDLAIITLSSPLPAGVPIYPLWGAPVGAATPFNMVGYGASGNGISGYTVGPAFDVKRWGANAVDMADPDDEASTALEVFYVDFDNPNGSVGILGGSTYGNNIETTLGGGDSGGPSFISVGGQLYLAGVNTFTFGGGSLPDAPLFGSGAGGILLEPYLEWIEANAPGVLIVPEPSTVVAGIALVGLTLGSFIQATVRRGRTDQRRS